MNRCSQEKKIKNINEVSLITHESAIRAINKEPNTTEIQSHKSVYFIPPLRTLGNQGP